MSASSVNLMIPMVAFPGRSSTSSSDAGSMLSLTQPIYHQSSLSRSVPQPTGEPHSSVLSGLVDAALPFTPFFLPSLPPDLSIRNTFLRNNSPKDLRSSTRTVGLHQELPHAKKSAFKVSPAIESQATSLKREDGKSLVPSPPPPQLPLGRLSISDIPGSNSRRSSSSEQESYDQPPVLSPGNHPAKSQRTSDSSTPCGLQVLQMNGPDRTSMTGSGGTGTENLNWLADVATAHSRSASSADISGSAGSAGGHGHSSSPTRISVSQLSPSGPSSALVAGSDSSSISPSVLHSSSGSLFRPPISLPSPSDLTPQRLYTSQYHHQPPHTSLHTTSASGTNLPLYNQASHIPPSYAGYYSAQYGPTAYAQLQTASGHGAPALVHRQYFTTEPYSAVLASMGGHVPGAQQTSRPSLSQQPRSSAFHPASSSIQPSQLLQQSSPHPTAPSPTFPSSASYISNQARVQNLPSRSLEGSPASRDSERSHSASSHQRSPSDVGWDERSHISKMSPTLEMSSRSAIRSPSSSIIAYERSKQSPTSGMWAKGAISEPPKATGSAYRVPTGKEGSLKHRILRPPSISILDPPPSTITVSAPLSAPPTQTYHENLPSPKSYAVELTSSSSPVHQFNRHQVMPHPVSSSVISSPIVPAPSPTRETSPSFVPVQSQPAPSPSTHHLQYPVYYNKGSLIQLTNGELKRVEDMTLQDFIDSTTRSEDLRMDSCTVVKIQEAQTPGSVLLNFLVGQRKVQVTTEAPVEHPFFVFNQGWSSYSPEQTMQLYGLSCQKLKIGDVCVSLTRKKPCSTSPPATEPAAAPPPSTGSTPSTSRSPIRHVQGATAGHHLPLAASISPSLPAVPEEENASTVTSERDVAAAAAAPSSTKCEERPTQENRDWLQTAKKSRTDNNPSPNQVPRKRKRHWSAPDQVSLETTPRTTSC